MMKQLILSILFLMTHFADTLAVTRILAIGNSFSEDAVESYLHDICVSENEEVVIGSLFIPACSIDRHYENLTGNKAAYRFRIINASGKVTQIDNATLRQALKREKWDYITFQQASEFSGIPGSYSNLTPLMEGVREIAGPGPVFCLHVTWAYAAGSKHPGFARYGNNQLQMYHDIEESAREIAGVSKEIKVIIPTGTAIQDARTAMLVGDDMTRDGYHLNLREGRYIASLTWYAAIFRRFISKNVFRPKGVSEANAALAAAAAHEAVLHPWRITVLSAE